MVDLYYRIGDPFPKPLPSIIYVDGKAKTGASRFNFLSALQLIKAPDKPSSNAEWTGSGWSEPPSYNTLTHKKPVWNGSTWDVARKTFDERFPAYTKNYKDALKRRKVSSLRASGDRLGALEEFIKE